MRGLIAKRPPKAQLLGQRLFVLIAHPDDESYLVAGTLARNRAAGGTATVVCATDGEKGTARVAHPVTKQALAKIREQELRSVARLLRLPRLFHLRFPDGGLRERTAALLIRTGALLRAHSSDRIVSFGPDGFTGHHDHIACYRVAKKLASEFSLPLWCFTVPPRLAKDMPRWLAHRRHNHAHYRSIPGYLRSALRVAVDPLLKHQCLCRHRSQLAAGDPWPGFPKHAVRTLMAGEFFSPG